MILAATCSSWASNWAPLICSDRTRVKCHQAIHQKSLPTLLLIPYPISSNLKCLAAKCLAFLWVQASGNHTLRFLLAMPWCSAHWDHWFSSIKKELPFKEHNFIMREINMLQNESSQVHTSSEYPDSNPLLIPESYAPFKYDTIYCTTAHILLPFSSLFYQPITATPASSRNCDTM